MLGINSCTWRRVLPSSPLPHLHLPERAFAHSSHQLAWHSQLSAKLLSTSIRARCKRGSTDASQSPDRLDHESLTPQSPSSSSGRPASADGPVSQQQESPKASHSSSKLPGSPAPPSAAEEVDQALSKLWDDLKREMRKDLDPETAKVLDNMSYDDLTGSNAKQYFRKLAGTQLGPILSAMGLNVDPFGFLIEMVKLAAFLQFITCGLVWFGSQSIGHFSTGEALTATAALAIGYLSRPAFKMELLLYPVYNAVLRLFLPSGTFAVPPSSRQEAQGVLNRLGVTLALCFLLPQLLWGWDGSESTVFVVPLCTGWFLFDLTYMMGLLLFLQSTEE